MDKYFKLIEEKKFELSELILKKDQLLEEYGYLEKNNNSKHISSLEKEIESLEKEKSKLEKQIQKKKKKRDKSFGLFIFYFVMFGITINFIYISIAFIILGLLDVMPYILKEFGSKEQLDNLLRLFEIIKTINIKKQELAKEKIKEIHGSKIKKEIKSSRKQLKKICLSIESLENEINSIQSLRNKIIEGIFENNTINLQINSSVNEYVVQNKIEYLNLIQMNKIAREALLGNPEIVQIINISMDKCVEEIYNTDTYNSSKENPKQKILNNKNL